MCKIFKNRRRIVKNTDALLKLNIKTRIGLQAIAP
jgi:hypothetical protein